MRKLVTIILSVLCGACLIGALAACGGQAEYTVTVKSVGGTSLKGVTVNFYDKDLNRVASEETDNTGTVSLQLNPDVYTVRLAEDSLPKGYEMPEVSQYQTKAESDTISFFLESHVIDEPISANHVYQPGDVMYDFTATTTTGDTFKLSEVLAEKRMVLLNFFYIDCYYCDLEFPYLVNAYKTVKDEANNILYSDQVAVLALDVYAGASTDTDEAIEAYKSQNGWTNSFDWAQDTINMRSHFTFSGTPTSVIIDRYGVFCELDEGAIQATSGFTRIFSKYTSDNYRQDEFNPDDENPEIERPKPNVSMPDSSVIEAAVNGTNVTGEKFNGTYRPTTDTSDAEYSWPWLAGEEDGRTYIYNSNQGVQQYSFATVHLDFHAKKGDVLAFDYYADIEDGYDRLYIVFNNGQVVNTLSGLTDGWQTCYFTYIEQEGDYEVYFLYNADEMNEENSLVEDIVKISNIRLTNEAEMKEKNASLEIRYECATDFDADRNAWTNYVEVGYNTEDGYYRLKAENDGEGEFTGPLVLLNTVDESHWSNKSIFEYANDNQFDFTKKGGPDYTKLITDYCSYAANCDYTGYVPVTKELHDALVDIARLFVEGEDNHETYPNEWLEMCAYVKHYGAGEAVKDPLKNIAPFTATELFATGDATDTADLNEINITKPLMPRGAYYYFIPEQDGVYEFKAYGKFANVIWIYNADDFAVNGRDGELINDEEGPWLGVGNFTVYVPLRANVKYYVCLDMYNQTDLGTYHVGIKHIGDSYTEFHAATPQLTYTTSVDANGNMTGEKIIVTWIDGTPYVNGDGQPSVSYKGHESAIYVDLLGVQQLLVGYDGYTSNRSLEDVFLSTEDEMGFKVAVFDENGNHVDKDGDGVADFEYIKYEGEELEYLKGLIAESKTHEGELHGMVQVDEKLMGILNELANRVSDFRNGFDSDGNIRYVEHEWLAFCYYYRTYTL